MTTSRRARPRPSARGHSGRGPSLCADHPQEDGDPESQKGRLGDVRVGEKVREDRQHRSGSP